MPPRNGQTPLLKEFVIGGLSIRTVAEADYFIRKLPRSFDALRWLAAGACVENAAKQPRWAPRATAAFEDALRAEGCAA